MANRRAPVTQNDLTRYVKAVAAAGVAVGEVKIEPDGTVRIIPAGSVPSDEGNPCHRLLK
jgi:hypothetical protein